MEKCKICGMLMKRVTPTHLKKHNTSKDQYNKLNDSGLPTVIKIDGSGERLCRVCGKQYKRMRQEHLDKHGITKEEYAELPPYGFDSAITEFEDGAGNKLAMSATDIDRLVPAIKDIMLKRGSVQEQAKSVLQELFNSKESEFRLLINTLAMHKMDRISTLLKAKESIEDKLITNVDTDKEMDSYMLLRILKAVSDDVKSSEDLFKDLGGLNPRIDNSVKTLFNILLSSGKDSSDIPDKVGEREKAMSTIKELIDIIENDQIEEGEVEKVDD